jgi:hypothetical protein
MVVFVNITLRTFAGISLGCIAGIEFLAHKDYEHLICLYTAQMAIPVYTLSQQQY